MDKLIIINFSCNLRSPSASFLLIETANVIDKTLYTLMHFTLKSVVMRYIV